MNEITKLKISRKLKNRCLSATHKEKISQSLRGRKLSNEHKEKIKESMIKHNRNIKKQ